MTGITTFRRECAEPEHSCGSQIGRCCLPSRFPLIEQVDPTEGGWGRKRILSAPGQNVFALPAAIYQQQGSMPAQHAAPATQQEAANAVTEKAEALIAATALM